MDVLIHAASIRSILFDHLRTAVRRAQPIKEAAMYIRRIRYPSEDCLSTRTSWLNFAHLYCCRKKDYKVLSSHSPGDMCVILRPELWM